MKRNAQVKYDNQIKRNKNEMVCLPLYHSRETQENTGCKKHTSERW